MTAKATLLEKCILTVSIAICALIAACGNAREPLPAEVMIAWDKAGAQVDTDNDRDEQPVFRFAMWQAGLFSHLPAPPTAFGIDLGSTQVSDDGLKELARFEELQLLDLSYTKVTAAGLERLAGRKHLQSLELRFTQIMDPGMKAVGRLNRIETLGLSYTKITNSGLKELAQRQQLQRLNLRGTQVTDEGLSALVGLEQLRSLNLYQTRVTDFVLRLSPSCSNCGS